MSVFGMRDIESEADAVLLVVNAPLNGEIPLPEEKILRVENRIPFAPSTKIYRVHTIIRARTINECHLN